MLRTPIFFRIVFLACLTALSTGCVAYKYSSTWFIENASTHTITVRTVNPERDGEEVTYELKPKSQRAVFIETNKCAENFTPTNRYSPGQLLPPASLLSKFEIWVGEVRLPDDIRDCENWDYYASEYIEKYTLSITDELIHAYGDLNGN